MKPSIPKGTRDFGPVEMARRNFIFRTIEDIFRLHGFLQIETPAMETLETLMGKYGEEGDRLIFRILNSGDFKSGINPVDWANGSAMQISNQICEKALRYDLTVPFARYVVMNAGDIVFPFKRYQLQPVWRADRPQKGRYREFYQCDADIVGSNALLNEAELMQLIDEIFSRLQLKVITKLNNRKILTGIAAFVGRMDMLTDITTAIDKLEKAGFENVKAELMEKGLKPEEFGKLEPFFHLGGTNTYKLESLKNILSASEIGLKGIDEMETLLKYVNTLQLRFPVEVDFTLARGLNYYTGTIIEVKSAETAIGSICGGGRYDDLTGIFGMKNLSGVGISFGADRIYDVMLQLERFPASVLRSTEVLVVNFGGDEEMAAIIIANKLRNAAIAAELYPGVEKLKKQFAYADAKKIKWVVVAGADEIATKKVTVKNMETGQQETISEDALIQYIQS